MYPTHIDDIIGEVAPSFEMEKDLLPVALFSGIADLFIQVHFFHNRYLWTLFSSSHPLKPLVYLVEKDNLS